MPIRELTDLQLAVLMAFIEHGGTLHSYGAFLELKRNGYDWREQAVRQAIERLTKMGILGAPNSQTRRTLDFVVRDMAAAQRLVISECDHRSTFLTMMRRHQWRLPDADS